MALPATQTDARGKGKGRATEHTPLLQNAIDDDDESLVLGGSSARYRAVSPPPSSPSSSRRQRRARLLKILTHVFIISFTASVVLAAVAGLLIWSYARRADKLPADRALRAIAVRGPDDVKVLQVQDGAIRLHASGLVGVDADVIMGWDDNEQTEDESIWWEMWRGIGRWGIGVVKTVEVEFGEMVVYPLDGSSNVLFTIKADPITLPLTTNVPSKRYDWLKPVGSTLVVQPTNDSALLERFVIDTWEGGAIDIRVEITEIRIRGVGGGWRSWIRAERPIMESLLNIRIPDLPGIPHPRPPLAKLLNLVSYTLTNDNQQLRIDAFATIPNPIPTSNLSLPTFPYEVSLLAPSLSPLPIAQGTVTPVKAGQNISLPIQGKIIPIPRSTPSDQATAVLSFFLTNFLSGIPAPVLIETPLFPGLQVQSVFPAPIPPPNVLRNVTIRRMMFGFAPDGEVVANGLACAKLVMPRGVDIPVNATHVWPDLLVYDGEVDSIMGEYQDGNEDKVPLPTWIPHIPFPFPHFPNPKIPSPLPSSDTGTLPPLPFPWRRPHPTHGDDPAPPLPDPLPERAFARIRPYDWLPAQTHEDEEDDDDDDGWVLVKKKKHEKDGEIEGGWTATITAEFRGVPVQVLPGREAMFTSFVSKVVRTREGALAGVKGTAGVRAIVEGLIEGGEGETEGGLQLNGLPFTGSVRVGKKGI